MLEEDDQSAAAKANIAAYNEQVCGIAVDDEQDDSSDFDPQAGTISEQAIAELVAVGFTEAEATCVFNNFDFNDPDAAEPDVIMDILAMCDIDLERLADLGG